VQHTVVRTHPETGQLTICFGDMAESVSGMDHEDGRDLIEQLNELMTRPEIVDSHQWKPGELVVWDNGCTLHRSMQYDPGTERRVMRRLDSP
jgi:alpha-ketoglutarate-dependent 2,4-dichlorophenoxyacetate dioxygenase